MTNTPTAFERRFAALMRDPDFAAGYRAARERIDRVDQRVRAAIDDGRLPADWENWSAAQRRLAQRIGQGRG